jgi:integrase
MGTPKRLAEEDSGCTQIEEVQSLLSALDVRERTMALLDVVTGLWASELFALKWTDINFNKNEISVTRPRRHARRPLMQNRGVAETSSAPSASRANSPHVAKSYEVQNRWRLGLRQTIQRGRKQ